MNKKKKGKKNTGALLPNRTRRQLNRSALGHEGEEEWVVIQRESGYQPTKRGPSPPGKVTQ